VVVWIFAGGGEAEIRGLVNFFRKHFINCEFERKTPIRPKPVPQKVKKKRHALGQTGESLAKQIGFAAPELEAWIIADWDNTIAKLRDFRQSHLAMQWWLSTQNINAKCYRW